MKSRKSSSTQICDNCGKKFKEDQEVNLMDPYKTLFYNTCVECTPTCSYCGQDSGYAENEFISNETCGVCDKDSCRSCGINITCYSCGYTACENCIEEKMHSEGVCMCMKVILDSLRKKATESEK